MSHFDWRTLEENDKIKCQYVLNKFVKPDYIVLDNLNYNKKSDRFFVNYFIHDQRQSDHQQLSPVDARPQYPFKYLCHGTKFGKAEQIEKDEGFCGSKGPTQEFAESLFTWWHIYPYSSPDFDVSDAKITKFTDKIKTMKNKILTPFEDGSITEEEKEKVQRFLVTSGVFKLKLFPFVECNFVYSLQELFDAYKLTMNCKELAFKKYGTFLYRKLDKPTEFLREIMYAIIVCPADSEEFSDLDDATDADDVKNFLRFDNNPSETNPQLWEWIPYSTSAGNPTLERHWDHVAFAFYLTKKVNNLCQFKRKPTHIPVLEGNLPNVLQNIRADRKKHE